MERPNEERWGYKHFAPLEQRQQRESLPLCRFSIELVNLRIALAVVGETPALYILIVRIKRRLNNVECVRVRPEELRLKVRIQANQILIDENLPAHTGTGADADRGNL